MPPKFDYNRFVVGYHGCDADLARKILLGDVPMKPSANKYDWLGQGIYFWEHGPARAMQFATAEARRNPGKITVPAVLGAYLYLGNCFDLLDLEATSILSDLYSDFVESLQYQGVQIPQNERTRSDGTQLFHALDRAVIEFAVKTLEADEARVVDTVRGAFWEGARAFPGSEIARQSHIQIAVRNPKCVLGYFKPKIN